MTADRAVPPQFSGRIRVAPEGPCGSRGAGSRRRQAGLGGKFPRGPGLRADLSRRSRLRSAQGAGTAGAGLAAGLSEVWGPREAARIVRAWARLPQPHPPLRGVQAPRTIRRRGNCVVIGERPGGEAGRLGSGLSPRGAWSPAPRPVGVLPSPKGASCKLNPRWLVGAPSVGCPLCPLGWGLLPGGCQLSQPGSVSGTRCLGEHMGAGCAGHRHPVTVTGWGTCANEHASGGVGCVLVSGVSSACAQSCWAGTRLFSGPPWGQRHWDVSTQAPCSQVTALKANAGQASCLLSPGVWEEPPVQGSPAGRGGVVVAPGGAQLCGS